MSYYLDEAVASATHTRGLARVAFRGVRLAFELAFDDYQVAVRNVRIANMKSISTHTEKQVAADAADAGAALDAARAARDASGAARDAADAALRTAQVNLENDKDSIAS
jgi:hypothetical protein